jgi:hypothetical protein
LLRRRTVPQARTRQPCHKPPFGRTRENSFEDRSNSGNDDWLFNSQWEFGHGLWKWVDFWPINWNKLLCCDK